jgi:Tol biopolymer transport system component
VDIFVHDRQTALTTRVSVNSSGVEADDDSNLPSISADGRFVAFASSAQNLVTNGASIFTQIFVHDRQTGQTSRVSVSNAGSVGNNNSTWPALSADGLFVAFESSASNLVPADSNALADVFVRDRANSLTTRVSVASDGAQGNLPSNGRLGISSDGRCVAFQSRATNLVQGDTNSRFDIFVRDRLDGVTTRVSVSSQGAESNGHSQVCALSGDGRVVLFENLSSDLAPDDHNNSTDIFFHDRDACPGDANADGAIDFLDLNAVLSAFGSCAGDAAFLVTADLNGDNCVDFLDLNTVLGFFGSAC